MTPADDFSLIMRNVKDYAIILSDGRGLITGWNAGAEAIFGYPREEVLGRSVSLLFTPEDAAQRAHIGEMRKAGKDQAAIDERWHIRKDGSRFWASGMLYPLLDDLGELHGYVKILRDFSERMEVADLLLESEKKLEFILEHMKGHALFMMDPQGRIATWNRGAARLLGFANEEILGRHFSVLFTDEDVQNGAPLEELAKAGSEGKSEDDRWYQRKDGSRFWASGAVMPLPDHHGRFRGFIKILRDASDRKRDEDAQRMESIGRLAGGVAHDFNNMLTTIGGYSELLLASPGLDEYFRTALEEIRQAGNRAAALTRQLLAFGGRQMLEPLALDLNDLILNMEKLLRSTLGDRIQLATDLEPGLEKVHMDPSQMEQILLNLALNARDAMADGGQVFIRTAIHAASEPIPAPPLTLRPGRYVLLSFRDTGEGMDAKTRANAFEPFFTTKKMGAKPIGLGLASVYGILRQSGGAITLESRSGMGTEFRIYLPAHQAAKAPAAPGPATAEPADRIRETILVVEDEDSVRKLAGRVARAGGYTVLEARDGEAALAVLAKADTPIHLILTDVIMPRMGGFELARRVRAMNPDIRLAFMSGYTEDASMHREAEQVRAVFIQKPFTPALLLGKLAEALAAAHDRT